MYIILDFFEISYMKILKGLFSYFLVRLKDFGRYNSFLLE